MRKVARALKIAFVFALSATLVCLWYVTHQPSEKAKIVQSYHNENVQFIDEGPSILQTYIKVGQFDLKNNDMVCQGNESCNDIEVKGVEEGIKLCNKYGDRCQGFVFRKENSALFFKDDVNGKKVEDTKFLFYAKRKFYKMVVEDNSPCALKLEMFGDKKMECKLPEIDPFSEHIMEHMPGKEEQIECPGKRLTKYVDGVLSLTEGVDQSIKSIKVQAIHRNPETDWGVNYSDLKFNYPEEKSARLDAEFLKVEIERTDAKNAVEYHAQVIPSPEAIGRTHEKGGLDVDVLMIGYDSTSSAQMQRAMPEAYKYLKDDLESYMFEGYSIVGDGTTPQLAAMLAGSTEEELPEARRNYPNADHVDKWPFIFKEYRSRGYATMYTEDDPYLNCFNYRLRGFKHLPTDHYSRTFWQAVPSGLCNGPVPQPEMHFAYIESFMKAYPKTPKFGFAFLSAVSHNSLTRLRKAHKHFTAFLHNLKNNGHLDNTILVVFGDHGRRFGEARGTLQLKQEERLPFLSITVPKRLRGSDEMNKYLKENTKRLLSPFDMHATLHDMLTYPKMSSGLSKVGLSLLRAIPPARSCAESGIPEHFCPCTRPVGVPISHIHIEKAAHGLVDEINRKIHSDELSSQKCVLLQLEKINNAYQNLHNPRLIKFRKSGDVHGREPVFNENVEHKECRYEFSIQTNPGGAQFEGSVLVYDGVFQFGKYISRINRYGDQPKCIAEKRPYMRKFCLCKDFKH